MMKSVFLLVVTNIAVMAMIAIVVKVFNLEAMLQQNGLNVGAIFLISAIFGFSGSFISLLMSKTMAKHSMGVEIISKPQNETEAWLYNTVKSMSEKQGHQMPEVGIFQSEAANAFATGASRDNALVAVSTGLLQIMNKDEVEAVIGHEMAHINNGDMVTSTLLQGVMNTFVFFFARIVAQILSQGRDGRSSGASYFMISMLMQIVLGVLASMVVMWFSRYREYKADQGGAALTSRHSMAGALRALKRVQDANRPTALPDQLAAFGITAFGGLLATHPPLEKRIAALESRSGVIQ